MKKKKISQLAITSAIALVVILIMVSQSSAAQNGYGQGGGSGYGQNKDNAVDENSNGIPDGQEDFDGDGILNKDDEDYEKQYVNMRDADEDGIANRDDEDYTPTQDGTNRPENVGGNGQQIGFQNAENLENGIQNKNTDQLNNRYNNSRIDEQVRALVQNQNQNQEVIEGDLAEIKDRNGINKFFFGPSYGKIDSVEEKLIQLEDQIEQLRELADQSENADDKMMIEEQIEVMEQVQAELEIELEENDGGFSLFGWAVKMFQ